MKALKSRRKNINPSYSFKEELPFTLSTSSSLSRWAAVPWLAFLFFPFSADPQQVFQDSIRMTSSLLEIITQFSIRETLPFHFCILTFLNVELWDCFIWRSPTRSSLLFWLYGLVLVIPVLSLQAERLCLSLPGFCLLCQQLIWNKSLCVVKCRIW